MVEQRSPKPCAGVQIPLPLPFASVMELVDIADSKSAGRHTIWVRVPSLAPIASYHNGLRAYHLKMMVACNAARITFKK